MKPAILRPFEGGDLRRVMHVERASFGVDAWPADLFREYAADRRCLFLVACAGRCLAGYAIVCACRGASDIASLAVLPRYRGRGLGTLLIDACIREARRLGAPAVYLMVRRDNLTAIRLYRGLGFVRTATVRSYYEDGAAGWRMRLRLEPAAT